MTCEHNIPTPSNNLSLVPLGDYPVQIPKFTLSNISHMLAGSTTVPSHTPQIATSGREVYIGLGAR